MAGKKKKAAENGRERGGFKASRHGAGQKASAAGPKSSQKKAAEEREAAGHRHTSHDSKYLRGGRIEPAKINGGESTADLIDNAFLAYNAARLREGCQLFTKRMLENDVTVGMTLTGAAQV